MTKPRALIFVFFLATLAVAYQREIASRRTLQLPTSKLLVAPVPGRLGDTNGLPVTAALSPDGHYLVTLNAGYGTAESEYRQSLTVLHLESNHISDFPEPRLAGHARQSFFIGLTFSGDGQRLYAGFASITDPTGKRPRDTGNGIAVYGFDHGRISPERFIPIPLQPLAKGKQVPADLAKVPKGSAIPYPAGIAVVPGKSEKLLVANNYSDNAVLLDPRKGKILKRFDLSTGPLVPSAFPYGAVVTRDGKRAFISLWNASQVAELDLKHGRVTRSVPLLKPSSATAAGSHPTAMLLSRDESLLYVTLANADAVAVVQTRDGKLRGLLSTRLRGQEYGGTYPNALAQSADGKHLFVANASSDAVAVFDVSKLADREAGSYPVAALGFIPTDWYPTALAVRGDDLLIASGKGQGTSPNPMLQHSSEAGYIATLLHGSIARLSISKTEPQLAELTREVEHSNLMNGEMGQLAFRNGTNPIRHVIYIIKENRTYDQVFGDLKPGDGDPSLCMYGEDITPNQHKLARQFGILDNFYDSGEVSGDGHVWSTAAITSDYTEKTWQIAYRGGERTYDYEGEVAGNSPLADNEPDVNEPQTGYIWTSVASHHLTYRHYGEFVATSWCGETEAQQSPQQGTPSPAASECGRIEVKKGEPLPPNVGVPHGSPSPYPWRIPLPAHNLPTKPELRGHFDPNFPDFRVEYPDQLRVDEFLNEFSGFVRARQQGSGEELPAYVLLRLPNDHTSGKRRGSPTPSASVADNDLAVGRVVEAISHSAYWDDTAILVLEDDAQDGADHVDAHRSIALVISKYSPGSPAQPVIDHHFYTTVNLVRTIEALLGLPPMNNNDARAAVMSPLFAGQGDQPPFTADYRNRDNGLLFTMNAATGKDQDEEDSELMDFTHEDRAEASQLNAILWRDRMGNRPMPLSNHAALGGPRHRHF
ncbi:MAG TPA: bifunctional YncE family protein/alkaline phosphatase family protein [Terriglobales bacterium]|nr:bifunctional YncE family protein/alkaline phosphatase family protein [Terriglobales bacterium]